MVDSAMTASQKQSLLLQAFPSYENEYYSEVDKKHKKFYVPETQFMVV
jgi:hypothetical protein